MGNFRYYIISFLYLIVGLMFLLYLYMNKNKYANKYGHNGFVFSFMLYYIIVPIILFLNINDFISYEQKLGIFGNNLIFNYVHNISSNYFLIALLLIILFFIFFNVGYNISQKNDDKRHIYINENRLEKLLKFFVNFSFFIGSISLILFFNALGGIKNALSMAEYLRSFSSETSDLIGKYSLLFISSRLITLTPFLSSYFIIKYRKKKNSLYYILLLIISFILSILFYLYNAGRFPLICFLLALVYTFLHKRVKKTWLTIIILGIICLPILDILDSLFTFFASNNFKKIDINYIGYVYQFVYPIRNVINIIPITSIYGFHYFTDIPLGIIDIIPGISFQAPYVSTSEYFNGYNWKFLGGIPNDIITFSFIQFHFFGIIIYSFITGVIIQKIDHRLEKINNNSKYYLGAYLSLMCFSIVNNADTFSFIKSQFFLIIIFIILIFSTRKKADK